MLLPLFLNTLHKVLCLVYGWILVTAAFRAVLATSPISNSFLSLKSVNRYLNAFYLVDVCVEINLATL